MMLPRHSAKWQAISDRALAIAADLPADGLSLAAFERAALFDVDPAAVRKSVVALRRQGVVWTRQSGTAVRVYGSRPPTITGIFASATPVEAFASKAAVHLARIAVDVRLRDEAKKRRDALAAQEARERLSATAGRLVALVARHTLTLGLAECRRALWCTFHSSAMEFVASFEPALAENSARTSFSYVEARPRRIARNLALDDRVIALIEKAGSTGATKSSLCRSIRPRVLAAEIEGVLASLVGSGQVVERSVRVRGSGRRGVRFFGTQGAAAAEG